jgi:PAS domain S-box-containing protein
MPSGKILLLEDDEVQASAIIVQLNKVGYAPAQVLHCTQLPQIQIVDAQAITIILASICLKEYPPKKIFSHVQKKFPFTPVVILTCSAELDFAIDTLHLGAQDYLMMGDFDEKVLEKTMLYAIERKKSANDFLRLFAENPVPMYIYDFETHAFLSVNHAALRQYGYTEEEMLAMKAEDIRPDEDVATFLANQDKIRDSYYDAGRWRHRRKNGQVFHVHIFVHLTEFEGRKAGAVMAIDVEQEVRVHQRAEELNAAIREQKDRMDMILRAIPEVIWSRRADNQELTYINDAAARVYGYTPEELLGEMGPLINNVHPDDMEKVQAAVQLTKKEGKGKCEYRIIHRDGTTRHILDEAVCYPGAEGAPGTIMGIAIDITRHKEQLHKIEEQNGQLREIGWLQSHQVRGPVATILGLAALFDTANPANIHNTELLQKLQQAALELDASIQEVVKKTYNKPG